MTLSPFLKLDIPVTFKDHPGVESAVLYTDINLCNLNCFKCHNRALYSGRGEKFGYEELKEKLNNLRLLGVELVIISGGEPLLEKKLEEGLKFLKSLGFPVRIDTNGTLPERMEELIEKGLADGFALDIKIPLKNEYSEEELKRFKKILFSREDVSDEKFWNYVNSVRESLELLKKHSLPYNILRTVRYPLLTESDLELIKNQVKFLPHQVNPFYDVEVRK
jgi:pyruvate formate lyase activating enzyme